MQVVRIGINVPKDFGEDAVGIMHWLLDIEVKLLMYPDCSHPVESWFCDSCEDKAESCNCNECNVICGECNENVEDIEGHLVTCIDHDGNKQILTFKQQLERKKRSLLADLEKILKSKKLDNNNQYMGDFSVPTIVPGE